MDNWIETDLLGVHGYSKVIFPPAMATCLDRLRSSAGGWLPDDYVQLMLQMDGFDGVVGKSFEQGGWLMLQPCEVAIGESECLNLTEYEPNLFILGSDGGGMAYLLDKMTREWVEMPYESFGETGEDRMERRFPDLVSMLTALANGPG